MRDESTVQCGAERCSARWRKGAFKVKWFVRSEVGLESGTAMVGEERKEQGGMRCVHVEGDTSAAVGELKKLRRSRECSQVSVLGYAKSHTCGFSTYNIHIYTIYTAS